MVFVTLEVAMKFSTLAAALASDTRGRRRRSFDGARSHTARHPYRNVNHANDAGNRKGDSETDKLNQQQLDQAKTPQ